jgi:hypothetical protein
MMLIKDISEVMLYRLRLLCLLFFLFAPKKAVQPDCPARRNGPPHNRHSALAGTIPCSVQSFSFMITALLAVPPVQGLW